MATALAAFCARLGSFIGNWIFGYLIDNYCLPLILIVAAQLFCMFYLAFCVIAFLKKRYLHFSNFNYIFLVCSILSFLTPGRFQQTKAMENT